MKKLLIICSMFLTSHITHAQWINLGEQGQWVYMVSNNLGYRLTGFSQTPNSGTTNYTNLTTDDWQSETVVNTFYGTSSCCWIKKLDFLNFSTGLRAYANDPFTTSFHRTTDYGYSWTTFPGYVVRCVDMKFVNDTLGYVTAIAPEDSYKGQFYQTIPTGVTKLFEWDTLAVNAYSPIEFVNIDTGFVSLKSEAGLYYVYRTTERGVSWDLIFSSLSRITSIKFPESASTGYISTSTGIFSTIDSGDTWNPTANPATGAINAMDFLNNNCGYIAGSNGQIHKTMNGGNSWTTENSTVSTNLINIKIVDPENAYCVDQNGVLLKNSNVLSTDSGIPNETSIAIYPNPAHETIQIRWSDKSSKDIKAVRIYDQSGREVLVSTEEEITISSLEPGMYYLTIISEGTPFSSKFTKL